MLLDLLCKFVHGNGNYSHSNQLLPTDLFTIHIDFKRLVDLTDTRMSGRMVVYIFLIEIAKVPLYGIRYSLLHTIKITNSRLGKLC